MGEAKKSCSSKSWNLCHDNVGHSCYQLCINGCIGIYYFTYFYTKHDQTLSNTLHLFFLNHFQKESLVLSTKAWMVAFVSDFYYCIMAPILVLYANPTVWKSIRSVKRTMEQLPFVFTPYIRKNSIMPEATVTIISQP